MQNKLKLEAKNFLKPLIMAGSLVLWNPDSAVADTIQDSCQKIHKILKIQKKMDEKIDPYFYNIDYFKIKDFVNISDDFCKNPKWFWFWKELEKVWKNLKNFQTLEDKILWYEENFFDWDSENEKKIKEKKFFSDFFQIQKKFLEDFQKFSKNFSDKEIFSWNLKYEVKKWDTLFEIIKNILQSEKAEKINWIIEKLKKLDKNKLIKRENPRNQNKSITKLSVWDEIDFWYAVWKWVFWFEKNLNIEIEQKYENWFLLSQYIKWWNFPLNLDRNRIYNPEQWHFNAYCAWSMYQLVSDNYTAEFPISYDEKLQGQANAYNILNKVLKNWWEVLDTAPDSIFLVAISDENLKKYWETFQKKVKIKISKEDYFSWKYNWWELEEKWDKPYFEVYKYFNAKNIKKSWWKLRNPIDRIIQTEDWIWIWLQKNSVENLKIKSEKIYNQAVKNPWSLIFWHYTLTGEYPKIILEHYNRYLEKDKLTEEEKKIPPASFWSHYTFNLWVQKMDYDLRKLQFLNQKWENLPKKNIDLNQKISVKDAISVIIPWWNKAESDNFLDKEKIFKNVKIFIKTKSWEKYSATLFDFWKNETDLADYELQKWDIFSVKDVFVMDEYLAQWRVMPLTKILSDFENDEKWNYTFANFIPTSIIFVPEKFRQPVIPEYVKIVENTDWVDFAWIDSSQNFIVAEVDLKEIWNISKPFSLEERRQIIDFYNQNFWWKKWMKIAKWDENWKPIEWKNLVFFEYKRTKDWWKIIFSNQEKNFNEMFERWVEEWKYQKNDKNRVKHFLQKMWFYQINFTQINWTTKFPILKFTWDAKISDKMSIIENSDKFKLKNLEQIHEIWKKNWIKFLEKITKEDFENVQKVTNDSFYQAVLLSVRWFETWSWSIKSEIENLVVKFDEKFWTNYVHTIWEFQINLCDFEKIAENFFRKQFSDLEPKFQTEFNKKIFDYFQKKYWKFLWKKNFWWDKEKFLEFKNDIKKFLLDEDNTWTKFLAGLIFISEKEKNIKNYAKRYYWDEYFSIISQKTPMVWYKDNLLIWSFDAYKWSFSEVIIKWQSYILNKILYWNSDFPNEEIQWKIDIKFHKKLVQAVIENKDIIKKLWIKITDESIEKSLKWWKNWKYIYTSNLDRILWWKLFKKSMWNSDAENVFLILKKIYKAKFWKLPPMFMEDDFKQRYKFVRKWKNLDFFDNPKWFLKAEFKWTNDDKVEFLRWRNILNSVYNIISSKEIWQKIY